MKDYNFTADEIFNNTQNLNLDLDPKANWALNNLDRFPIEINNASREELLRIPGIGPKTADKIIDFNSKINQDNITKLRLPKKSRNFLLADGKFLGKSLSSDHLKAVL